MSWAVIDGDRLVFVGKFKSYLDCNVIDNTTLKDRTEPSIVCDIETGKDWSQLTEMEAGMLCRNHNLPFIMQNYQGNLQTLRHYAEQMEFSQITPEQIELFNEPMERLKNKYGEPIPHQSHSIVSAPTHKPQPQSRPASSKGATGRVWVIADECYHEMCEDGDDVRVKELRGKVIQACIEAGIHEATAATQWSKWKKDKGIV